MYGSLTLLMPGSKDKTWKVFFQTDLFHKLGMGQWQAISTVPGLQLVTYMYMYLSKQQDTKYCYLHLGEQINKA